MATVSTATPANPSNGQAGVSNGSPNTKCIEALDKAYDQLEILFSQYQLKISQLRSYEPKTQAGRSAKESQLPVLSTRSDALKKLMDGVAVEMELQAVDTFRSISA